MAERSPRALGAARLLAIAGVLLAALGAASCASLLRAPRERAPDFVVQRRFERAESLYKSGQLTDAYRLYEQLWDGYEPHAYSVPARMRMAELDLKQKNLDQAEDELRDVLASSPSGEIATRAQLLMGDLLYGRGDWLGAREHYQAFLAASPKAPETVAVLTRIGEIHERRGEHALALRAYDRALDQATQPSDVAAIQNAINTVLTGELTTAQLEETADLYQGRAIGVAARRIAAERPKSAPRPTPAPPVEPEPAPFASSRVEPAPPPAPPAPVAAALPPAAPLPSSEPVEPGTPSVTQPPLAALTERLGPASVDTGPAPADVTTPPLEPASPASGPELTVTPDTSPDLATTIAVEADVLALQRARQRSRDALTIVCLLPVTGKYAAFGLRALDGIIEAADVFRPAAGGEPVVPVRFVIGDTQGDPERAVALFDELVEPNHAIAILGPMVGKVAEVISQRAAASGTPMLTLARKATLAGAGTWAFRASLTDAELTQNLVKVATQDMGIKRFAVLYPNEPYGMEIRDMFVADVREAGGEIRAVAGFSPNASDFAAPIKTLLARRKPGDPSTGTPDDVGFDALFIPGSEANVKLIAPQLVFHGIVDAQLLGTNSWNSPKLVEEVGTSLQGAFFLDGFFPASPNPDVRTFVQRFDADFDRDATLVEALAFEAATLLRERVESGAARTRDELARSLRTLTDYRGIAGLTGFDSQGDAIRMLKALTVAGDSIQQVRWPVDPPSTTIRDFAPAAPRR